MSLQKFIAFFVAFLFRSHAENGTLLLLFRREVGFTPLVSEDQVSILITNFLTKLAGFIEPHLFNFKVYVAFVKVKSLNTK